MPKGQYSYILFRLDAYSQYVYALPLKDKIAPSVLQGFLSLFANTSWYKELYLDNETSFLKAAKILVKIAPIAVKKTFVKILNDSEQPHSNEDLATVTTYSNTGSGSGKLSCPCV
jgi:hypothetical protein